MAGICLDGDPRSRDSSRDLLMSSGCLNAESTHTASLVNATMDGSCRAYFYLVAIVIFAAAVIVMLFTLPVTVLS